MSYTAQMTQSDRQRLGREAYELALLGESDEAIADNLDVEVYQVVACREDYTTNRVSVPTQTDAQKKAIARAEHDLAEITYWQQQLRCSYEISITVTDEDGTTYQKRLIDIEKAGSLAVKLVNCKTNIGVRYAKLLGLDSPITVDVKMEAQADRDLEQAVKAHSALMELDAPLG